MFVDKQPHKTTTLVAPLVVQSHGGDTNIAGPVLTIVQKTKLVSVRNDGKKKFGIKTRLLREGGKVSKLRDGFKELFDTTKTKKLKRKQRLGARPNA
jgi:hypothetical protein